MKINSLLHQSQGKNIKNWYVNSHFLSSSVQSDDETGEELNIADKTVSAFVKCLQEIKNWESV